jgi:polyhydroxyalkanoate synthesis regulator phasin
MGRQGQNNKNGQTERRFSPRSILWVGLGAAAWTADTAASLVDNIVHADFAYTAERLINRGKRAGVVGDWQGLPWPLTREPAEAEDVAIVVVETPASPPDPEIELLTAVERSLSTRKLPTRDEINRLNEHISQLTQKVDQLTEGT